MGIDRAFTRRQAGLSSSGSGGQERRGGAPAPGDQTLSVLLAAGDDDAARTAWDRFSPVVRRILRRGLGPSHDVEDVVQDVFLRFYRRVPDLRDGSALRGFLIAITVNAMRSELRRQRVRRIVKLVDPVELPEIHAVDVDPEARAALRAFYKALDRLREVDRIAFVLRVIEGLSIAEVADALDVSQPTVRRRLARARARVSMLAARDPLLAQYGNQAVAGAP